MSRRFADLAQHLGFDSLETTELKRYPSSSPALATPILTKPVLVTSGTGEIKNQGCGLSRKEAYAKDSKLLYLRRRSRMALYPSQDHNRGQEASNLGEEAFNEKLNAYGQKSRYGKGRKNNRTIAGSRNGKVRQERRSGREAGAIHRHQPRKYGSTAGWMDGSYMIEWM